MQWSVNYCTLSISHKIQTVSHEVLKGGLSSEKTTFSREFIRKVLRSITFLTLNRCHKNAVTLTSHILEGAFLRAIGGVTGRGEGFVAARDFIRSDHRAPRECNVTPPNKEGIGPATRPQKLMI